MNERDAIVPPMKAVGRLPWPQYFLRICFLVSERSTCLRRKVGAVAVRDKRILATGYNGAPSNVAHCLDIGCLRAQLGVPSGQRHEICRGLHAEQNVIIQAAVHGVSIKDADIYCTTQPCLICSKMLANCGVKNIYYAESYPDEMAEDMLREAGINFKRLPLEPLADTDENDAR
ncbi:deoxycytidylate deaminase [Oceanidesulfovibrio marinus]|uniref:deoxycytidylate deaminase n=1 Tax=Oceanidesulfovibrio marinus TaxID=370038 RepID=UPI003CC82687